MAVIKGATWIIWVELIPCYTLVCGDEAEERGDLAQARPT